MGGVCAAVIDAASASAMPGMPKCFIETNSLSIRWRHHAALGFYVGLLVVVTQLVRSHEGMIGQRDHRRTPRVLSR
jgi:hypothetical protein